MFSSPPKLPMSEPQVSEPPVGDVDTGGYAVNARNSKKSNNDNGMLHSGENNNINFTDNLNEHVRSLLRDPLTKNLTFAHSKRYIKF